jgi:hypothetical protein
MEEIMGSGIRQKQTNLALAAGGYANVCRRPHEGRFAGISSPLHRHSTAPVLTAIPGSTFRRPALVMDCPISRDASGAQFAAA